MTSPQIDPNKLLLDRLSDDQITAMFDKARAAAQRQITEKPESSYSWFPCGFAWLSIRLRKNHKKAKHLVAAGFRWCEYERCYQLWAGHLTGSQVMEYKEDIMNAMAKSLREDGLTCYVGSRMD